MLKLEETASRIRSWQASLRSRGETYCLIWRVTQTGPVLACVRLPPMLFSKPSGATAHFGKIRQHTAAIVISDSGDKGRLSDLHAPGIFGLGPVLRPVA